MLKDMSAMISKRASSVLVKDAKRLSVSASFIALSLLAVLWGCGEEAQHGQAGHDEPDVYYIDFYPAAEDFWFHMIIGSEASGVTITSKEGCPGELGPTLFEDSNQEADVAFVLETFAEAVELGATDFQFVRTSGRGCLADETLVTFTGELGGFAAFTETASASPASLEIIDEARERINRVLRVGVPFRERDARMWESSRWPREVPPVGE